VRDAVSSHHGLELCAPVGDLGDVLLLIYQRGETNDVSAAIERVGTEVVRA
jgi:hypothetical protein